MISRCCRLQINLAPPQQFPEVSCNQLRASTLSSLEQHVPSFLFAIIAVGHFQLTQKRQRADVTPFRRLRLAVISRFPISSSSYVLFLADLAFDEDCGPWRENSLPGLLKFAFLPGKTARFPTFLDFTVGRIYCIAAVHFSERHKNCVGVASDVVCCWCLELFPLNTDLQ